MSAPICGPDDLCHDGDEGDPCVFDCHPELAPFCVDKVCHDGSDGDPCVFDNQCSEAAPHCVDDLCHDGGAGDPCVFDSDCADAMVCDNEVCT